MAGLPGKTIFLKNLRLLLALYGLLSARALGLLEPEGKKPSPSLPYSHKECVSPDLSHT
jgi:hypothetical protein